MSDQGPLYYPRSKDYQILGLYQIMTDINGEMLRQVLLWGTPRRQPSQPFSEYLVMTKGMPENKLRKKFNKGQLDKIENDSEMNSFDVTLLYLCLKYGTDGLAPPNDEKWWGQMDTLEGLLTCAKNFRNDFVHGEYVIDDALYFAKIEDFRTLINSIINKAALQFGIDQDEVETLLKDFNRKLNEIRDQAFNISANSFIYEQLCILLKIKGRIELEEKYKANSSTSVISNLLGRKIRVEIKKIFTNIKIHRIVTEELMAVDKLFEHIDLLDSKKNVLLIEGVAGAGKTTLTKLILHEWSKRSSKMKKLDIYDLAIWTEGRDGGIRSLAQLLHFLMPNATQKIQGDAQVIACIQKNVLLFIVDGLDELNESSERVFREILALKNADIITVVCTTRPNKARDITRYVPETFKILHVKISGIAEEDREDFVRNYNRALEGQFGTRYISGLLQFLKRKESRLQEHWRLPFNLVLLTISWLINPNIISEMTTATELFQKTFELCQERLIQRLHDNEATSRLSSNDIRENLTHFIKVMTKIAFESHYDDETVLSQKSVRSLKDTCKRHNLPHEEVLGAFLVQTTSVIYKNMEKFSFLHKGIQDFFCALHIEEAIGDSDANLNIPRILSNFEQILVENMLTKARIPCVLQVCREKLRQIQSEASSSCPTVRSVLMEEALKRVAIGSPDHDVQLDLRKWRNILVHLTGLLYHRGRSQTNERAVEMVTLLEESGIIDSNEWLDFLSNVNCDAAISKYIVLFGDVEICDAQVMAFLKVVDQAEAASVAVSIEGDPSLTPGLEKLLEALQKKPFKLRLNLHHDFRFPKEGGSVLDKTLLNFFRSNPRLTLFKGQLSATTLKELPTDVDHLWLSVKDGAHYRSLLPVLTSRDRTLTMEESLTLEEGMTMVDMRTMEERLVALYIHVPVDIDESSLRPLPRVPNLHLFVSDVGEATAEKASVGIRELQPSGGRFSFLRFPGVGRTPRACKRLLQELRHRGVQVDRGVDMSPSLEEGEEHMMNELAREQLGCGFIASSEDNIWTLG